MDGNRVTIIKDGRVLNIAEKQLCRDDVVVLQAGEMVPADLKLVEARELQVDEFDITGEIMPVSKTVEHDDTWLYMGSRITKGFGKGIVVASGDKTEFGNVLAQSWQRTKIYGYHLFELHYLALVLLLLPAVVILVSRSQNTILVIAVFLLVAAILVALQNTELYHHWFVSRAIRQFAREGIRIRDPLAIERMSDIDTVCFDKTGVLTKRDLEVTHVYYADTAPGGNDAVSNKEISRIVKLACALCHDVQVYEKLDQANPIDKAFVSFALNQGMDVYEELQSHRRIYDKPFDPENRYMAYGFERNGKVTYFAKGDPSVIMMMCDHYLTGAGEKKAVNSGFWLQNKSHIDAIAQNGGTAIALAYTSQQSDQPPMAFTFLCLLHVENSLQPGVAALIRKVSSEGKRCVLLTGDREETASRIGVDCGIANGSRLVLTGKMIERMSLDEVARQSTFVPVFARLLPSQKGLVIRLLQQRAHRVAMIGDGPNDGIALKAADIAISLTKESSPIARRLSKILVNDVTDLWQLIEASNRIKARTREFHYSRALLIIAVFASMYGWALAMLYHPG